MPARYLPVSLDVRGRPCVVIGGGHEAFKKSLSLLAAGACVQVISPDACPEVEALALAGRVTWERRAYRYGDLQGYFLAFACTDDERVNVAAVAEAAVQGVLLNVVDQPGRCDFIMPAVARQGCLTFAITTDGHSPALARRLRDEIQERYEPAYAAFAALLGALRPVARAAGLPLAARAEFFHRLVRSDALDRLLAGDRAGAYERIAALLGEYDLPWAEEWCSSSAPDPATRT